MNKKCRIILLPTVDLKPHQLILDNDILRIVTSLSKDLLNSNTKGQQLYVVNDFTPIMGGDWFLWDDKIIRCKYVLGNDTDYSIYDDKDKEYFSFDCKKIVATTDASLITQGLDSFSGKPNTLPRILPQFIKKYVDEYNRGNKINDIVVECSIQSELPLAIGAKEFIAPKIDKNNFIIIYQPKDNWSREELVDYGLIDKILRDFRISCLPLGQINDATLLEFKNNWIKNNL